jgi:deazaflavin-dependent oxidoreductase (nitroreductase family)
VSTSAGIPAFDPLAERGYVYRAMAAFTRTGVGRSVAINFAARTDPFLLKVSRGRLGAGLVMPTAGLTTTGAKSGRVRSAAVLYFTDGDDVILIASNFGREKHPSWYHNLKTHPAATLERGGRQATYTAIEVDDETERERLFKLADMVYAGYADYRTRTAAIGRRIPIMRLTLLA